MNSNTVNIFGKTLKEIKEICKKEILPSFTASQICSWIYRKGVTSFEEMTNLSQKNREILINKYKLQYIKPIQISKSADGTKKYLFPLKNNNCIEAAMIRFHPP